MENLTQNKELNILNSIIHTYKVINQASYHWHIFQILLTPNKTQKNINLRHV